MSAAEIEISGRWQMVRAEFDGESAPEEVAQRTILTITATHYSVLFAGNTVDHGSIEFPPAEAKSNKPQAPLAAATLHGFSGTNAGRRIPCVYQRVGNRLRICFGIGGVLPTEFSTANGQQRYLATYRLI